MSRKPPTTTTQMVALWSAAVEKKVAGSIAPLLQRLVRREGASLSPPQADTLSHVVARALQIAAAKGGGVSAAIDYLGVEAGEDQTEPVTPSRR
jgi:hypothetical protein